MNAAGLKKDQRPRQRPLPHEVVRVHGRPDEKIFRVRVGSYRILYVVDFEKQLIVIDSVDKRSRVYD